MACNHDGKKEGGAIWCFQFYFTGTAHTFLHSRLNGDTLAVKPELRKVLETYPEAINFLLHI